MDIPYILLAIAWGLMSNYWWLFLPIAVAWVPDGRHVKWTVAAGFVFYGVLAAYAFLGGTACNGPCGVELLSLPAWLLSSSTYLIVGLHRWVKASDEQKPTHNGVD